MVKSYNRNLPKCWSQRLWWVFVLLSVFVSYFVLRNFAMSYWVCIVSLGGFIIAGAAAGHFLGTYIDQHHRTVRGLRRQEIRLCRSFLRWLRRTLRRKGGKLEPSVLRKLEENITRFGELLENKDIDRATLLDERRRQEQFVEEHLARFKKGVVREYVESIGFAVLIALVLRAFLIEAFQIPSGSMIPSLRVGDHIFVNKLAFGIRVPLLPLKIFGLHIPALAWNWSMPKRGDVIVFVFPKTEDEDYIKRVVAVAGDTVVIKDGQVEVNGKPYAVQDRGPFEYNELDEEGRFRGRMEVRQFEENTEGVIHPILMKSCTSDQDCQWRTGTKCNLERNLCEQRPYDFKQELNDPANRSWGPYQVPPGFVFVMGDNRDNSQDSRYWGPVPLDFIKGKAEFIWWSYREGMVQWDRMFTAIH